MSAIAPPRVVLLASATCARLLRHFSPADLSQCLLAFARLDQGAQRAIPDETWQAFANAAVQRIPVAEPAVVTAFVHAFARARQPFQYALAVHRAAVSLDGFDVGTLLSLLVALRAADALDTFPWDTCSPLIASRVPDMDAAALATLAGLVCTSPSPNVALANAVAGRVLELISGMEARQVSMFLGAMHDLGRELTRAFVQRVNELRPGADVHSLSMMAAGLLRHPAVHHQPIVQLTHQVRELVPALTAAQLHLVATSFFHVRVRDDPIFAAIAQRAIQIRGDLSAGQALSIVDVCSRFGHNDEHFGRQMLARVIAQSRTLAPQQVAVAIDNLGRTRTIGTGIDLGPIRARYLALAASLTPTQHATCLQTFGQDGRGSASCIRTACLYVPSMDVYDIMKALAGVGQSSGSNLLEPVVRRGEELVPSMNSRQLATTLWSLVSHGRDRRSLFADVLVKLESLLADDETDGNLLAKIMWAGAFASLPGFAPVAQCCLARAVVCLRLPCSAAATIAWAIAALDLQDMDADHLAQLWKRVAYGLADKTLRPGSSTTQLWQAFLWMRVRFPTIVDALDGRALELIDKHGRASMAYNAGRAVAPTVAHGELVKLVRDLGGQCNVQEGFVCPKTGFRLAIAYTSPVSRRRSAVELLYSGHRFGNRLNGSRALRDRLLQGAGWELNPIDVFLWNRPGFDKIQHVAGIVRQVDEHLDI
ncbi:hypothetical protein PBRA_007892 [Plasmodiophora brassicae]|nr:hypothetical protein PBRA_007892 [Plasmodiophora brassicae]